MTGTEVPEFLLGWARRPGPDKVLQVARTRLERGRLGDRSVVDVPLSAGERQDVGQLLPAAWTSSGEPVRMRGLRAGLEAHGTTVEQLLVATGGPLRDLPAERRKAREVAALDRASALGELRELLGLPAPTDPEDAVSAALLRWVLRDGPAPQRAREVSRVVRALPREGDLPLAALAAAVFADAHALDRSRPLGRAMARFMAVRAAATEGAAGAAAEDATASLAVGFTDPVSSPAGWRAAWASAGVTCDAVSSQVLVLNLPLVGDAPAVAFCVASPGEPTWLTLRSLEGGFALRAPQDVFVCENPTIVEAAAAMSGARSRPLVCTFGRPTAAAWALLRGLGSDARLHVRADGDATGWSIVESFLTEFPHAVNWRMPEGTTAFEEELLADLLSDLAGAGDPVE